MKTIFLAVAFGMLLTGNNGFAQEEKNNLVTVTKMHWNMDLKNFSNDEWIAVEKEYLDKVVKKNPFILGQEILTHSFTEDNTEILLVTIYENWEAIEKANEKSEELIKAAWPDEKVRKAFFEKQDQYYAGNHSDEIYSTMPGSKLRKASFDKDMIFYLRVNHFAFPKDGTNKEFAELEKQFFDAVTNKNDLIKAYYPSRHAWGSDNTQFNEVYVVDSLADLELALNKNRDLFKAMWTDEAKKKEFNDKSDRYFTGQHGDYIYKSVHQLTK
jgi:hypothetical protein